MAEYEGVDALLAAITDEPLPEGARDDAEFMAEHRSAMADVALLRERLGVIGDALADGTKTAAPVKPVHVRAPRKRRPLAIAFGALAVACAAVLMAGVGWLVVQAGQGANDAASSSAEKAAGGQEDTSGSSLRSPGHLACSRLVVEGTVAQVEPLPDAAQDRVTLDVSRYYKPDKGKDQITFLMDEDAYPPPHKGDHVLVGIPRDEASPDVWILGEGNIARERAWIAAALTKVGDAECSG